MKLLDLETGKYLKIGKNWLYGREFILLNLGSSIECNIKEWGSVSYGDNAYGWHGFIGQEMEKPHVNPIINKLSEKVGAVIYGGRYVLLNEIPNKYEEVFTGDVIMPELNQSRYSGCYMDWKCFIADFYSFEENIYYAAGHHISYWRFYIDCNIFEEFAKKEQGLENKFDKLLELINQ